MMILYRTLSYCLKIVYTGKKLYSVLSIEKKILKVNMIAMLFGIVLFLRKCTLAHVREQHF